MHTTPHIPHTHTPHTKHTTHKAHHTQNYTHAHTHSTQQIYSLPHIHTTHIPHHTCTHTHTPGQGVKNWSRCMGFSDTSGVKKGLLPKIPHEKVAFGHIKWVPSGLEMSHRARPWAPSACEGAHQPVLSGRARPTPHRHPLRTSSAPSPKALPGQLAAPTPAPWVPQDGPDVRTPLSWKAHPNPVF